MFPYYFLHQNDWADFWNLANGAGHQSLEISSSNGLLFTKVYIYPWQFKQKFAYLGRFPAYKNLAELKKLSQPEFQTELISLLEKIKEKAVELDLAFLKFDFEDQFLDDFEFENLTFNPNKKDFQTLIQEIFKTQLDFPKINSKTKKIQYLATMTLDLHQAIDDLQNLKNSQKEKLEKFQNQKKNLEKETVKIQDLDLAEFYQLTQAFWKTTNQNIRRYTKKSLKQNWQISLAKTPENFEKFYQVYLKTAQRQKFAIHSKDYLRKFFDSSFSRIIILENQENQPQAVWLGIKSKQTLTYICGGNTQESFKFYGQYLIHLVAIFLASLENLPFYDLGGYDPALSFTDFKRGYRGKIRKFPGAVDVVLKPQRYNLITGLIKLIKFLNIFG